MGVPSELSIGDTWEWTETVSDYPASEGWTLTYYFINSTDTLSVTATADGDDYDVEIAATTTANYNAGYYRYEGYVEKSGERHRVVWGDVELTTNFAAAVAADHRPAAKKILDAINDLLEGRVPQDVNQYTIEGRSLQKMPVADLLRLKAVYERLYDQWKKEQRRKQGKGASSKVRVKFKAV